jgi:hypothetical protein
MSKGITIAREAMAKARVLPGCSAGGIRAVRTALIELGAIVRASVDEWETKWQTQA